MHRAVIFCVTISLIGQTVLSAAHNIESKHTQSAYIENNQVILKEEPRAITLFTGHGMLQLTFQDHTEVVDVKSLVHKADLYEKWNMKKFPCLSCWGLVYSAYCFYISENHYTIIIVKTIDSPDYY